MTKKRLQMKKPPKQTEKLRTTAEFFFENAGISPLTAKERQLQNTITALGYEIATAHGWRRYIGKAA